MDALRLDILRMKQEALVRSARIELLLQAVLNATAACSSQQPEVRAVEVGWWFGGEWATPEVAVGWTFAVLSLLRSPMMASLVYLWARDHRHYGYTAIAFLAMMIFDPAGAVCWACHRLVGNLLSVFRRRAPVSPPVELQVVVNGDDDVRVEEVVEVVEVGRVVSEPGVPVVGEQGPPAGNLVPHDPQAYTQSYWFRALLGAIDGIMRDRRVVVR